MLEENEIKVLGFDLYHSHACFTQLVLGKLLTQV